MTLEPSGKDERNGRAAADVGGAFGALVEGLRDDVREDLAAVEGRVTSAVTDVRTELRDARTEQRELAIDHGVRHENEADERTVTHKIFHEFMDQYRLEQARREGALGIFRFVVEILSHHGRAIVSILIALAAAFLAATGNIHIQIGFQ